MAQIHISKDPSGQRAVTFAYDPHVRRTSVTAEITAVAGAEGKNPWRLDLNNR